MKPIDFLRNYLNEIKPIEMDDNTFLKYRYLDNHLDSFAIIQFIMAIEDEFGISLLPEDTESEEFRTIEGVIKIIETKKEL
ncbi:acyl carrier protein [Hydrogenimonas thermophila]|uniref:Acyl carrier protein n=1 Tax=Hydrogenimonas thermophila TaxID=223786 RepID=A0A1I5LNG7_9BACT|nr:acyl carrier protein [Hydrogenimonas thermophila]WOE69927.1 acyl carrier protein [Hydrogenimonas thermophila]WOE72444.1 acyl carrier protein [Hydrogenimonas thermophila]SFO98311.1 acyl carrier protein [Hydrogenimonas thermophila]